MAALLREPDHWAPDQVPQTSSFESASRESYMGSVQRSSASRAAAYIAFDRAVVLDHVPVRLWTVVPIDVVYWHVVLQIGTVVSERRILL